MALIASNKSYFIFHGFAEGPHSSRKFEAELQARGFESTPNPDNASLIIAHSGGCLLVDPHTQAHVLLINPTVWPDQNYLRKFFTKLSRSFSDQHHMREACLAFIDNLRYTLQRPHHNVSMFKPYLAANKPSFQSPLKCTIIRNQDDAWCTPNIDTHYPNAQIHILPGHHDSCWIEPIPHIDIAEENA
jgi:hypothetical protein